MSKISITLPSGDDVPAVAALAWPDPAARKMQRHMAEAWFDAGHLVVAKQAGAVVGFIVVDQTFFDHSFVRQLVVAENHRRLGLGRALLGAITDRVRTEKLFTAVTDSNFPMRMLLTSLHWENVGTVRGVVDGASEMFYRAPLAVEPLTAENA